MKALFSVAGLLLVLAIVAILARSQLTSSSGTTAVVAPDGGTGQPAATPQQQVHQFKQAVDAGLHLPTREVTEDTK